MRTLDLKPYLLSRYFLLPCGVQADTLEGAFNDYALTLNRLLESARSIQSIRATTLLEAKTMPVGTHSQQRPYADQQTSTISLKRQALALQQDGMRVWLV